MRAAPWILSLGLLAALGACHRHAAPVAPSAAVSIPGAGQARQALGLWVQRISDRRGAAVTRYCLDGEAAARLSYLGRQLSERCRRNDMAEAADGAWRFSTLCDMGPWGSIATEGVARGDFQRHYVVEVGAQASGAAQDAANGPRRVVADLTWQGACPKDMKPGEVDMPDGQRWRVADLNAPA